MLNRLTQAQLEQARTIEATPGPRHSGTYLIHPADKKHLEDHGGGKPGCMVCVGIWQRATEIR